MYCRKHPGQGWVGLDFFQGETGPAPDRLSRLGFDPAGEFGEGIDLVEGVTPGETDVREGVGLDDVEEFVDRHPVPGVEIPGLGIVAALAVVGAACAIDGNPEARAVGHRLLQDFQYSDLVFFHGIICG